jgi:hypothetical protein
MPDLYSNTALAGNARKTVPSSQFGTRKLSFCVINVSDIGDNYTDADSVFYKAIRAIQQNVEIYAVGTPSGNYVTVVVADDTEPYSEGEENADGNRNGYLEDILDNAGISAEVWNAQLISDDLSYD